MISYLGCFMGAPKHPLLRKIMGKFTSIKDANALLEELKSNDEHPNTHLAVIPVKDGNLIFDNNTW